MNIAHEVVRYNLAFLLPHRECRDSGRILGYDNAHGGHERHFFGAVGLVDYIDYPATAERFYKEVANLRRQL